MLEHRAKGPSGLWCTEIRGRGADVGVRSGLMEKVRFEHRSDGLATAL